MNDEMMLFQRYYIRIRGDGAIPLMQAWSDAFDPPPRLEGLSDDILINDRGEGTQFRLEPGGEENPWQSMWDENGIPLLKWDGKKIVQRTETEIQADRDAMKPPLETHIISGIMQTHKLLAEALQTPIEHKGRRFAVTKEKQNLLSAQLGLFGLNSQAGIPMELSWNATGEVCEPWEFPALLELANVMAAYVEPLAQKQREVEVRIKQSKTEREVAEHVERFRNDLETSVGS